MRGRNWGQRQLVPFFPMRWGRKGEEGGGVPVGVHVGEWKGGSAPPCTQAGGLAAGSGARQGN
jgi:hypothetical protein